MKCFFLIIASLFSGLGINANVIDEIKGLYGYPYTICGIVIDCCVSNDNLIVYDCYIDKQSTFFKKWLTSKLNNLENDSLKHDIETVYEQNGGNIDLTGIDFWGELYDENCILYSFLKADFISVLCKRISTYKLEDDYNNSKLQIKFEIYNNSSKRGKLFGFTLSTQDISDAFLINKHQGDVYKVLLQKFAMLRGIYLNQKALPTQTGFGVSLDSITIQGNCITYYNGVSDLIANMTSTDDMRGSIEQMQLGLSGVIDYDNLKKAKGFPLLDMRLKYELYKSSDRQILCSVTFAYPSLNILSAWPESMTFDKQKNDFTETDDDTENIPICLYNPVDMGLSVHWASTNLGAVTPDEYGGLFGWGDVSGERTSLDYSDYPLPNDSECIAGIPEYDIARNLLGEYWHIPTSKEWSELYESCIWVYSTYRDVAGYKVIGPNGNAIFLPAAGFRDRKTDYNKGRTLNYWTSDLDKKDSRRAVCFYHEISAFRPVIDAVPRWRGQSVRPVYGY